MFNLLRFFHFTSTELLRSELFDQTTFYSSFTNDLKRCRRQVILESPFITSNRMSTLLPIFQKLRKRGVEIIINTRDPQEYEFPWEAQTNDAIYSLGEIGVQILYTGGHHRKLAILDEFILWEGSLNILSQNDSCEIMRRIKSHTLAKQMISFTHVDKFLR